jgi:peroxiredoxin
MKKKFAPLLWALLSASFMYANNIFYVDKISGNDKNDGKTRMTAWKSLDKVNSLTFQPGDHIYLKRGQVFDGYLHLKGSGKDGLPIKLTAFGTGNRPVINAAGYKSAIKILDADHWEIADIETTGGNMAGIFIGCTRDSLTLNHFRVINCYAHDIGDTAKLGWDFSKFTGGIIVVNEALNKEGKPVSFHSTFNDVIIDGCIVRYNWRWTCISISSGKKDGKGGNANYIRNCITEFSVADAIRMNGVRNSFIEYCVMYHNGAWPKIDGRNLGGLGAWFFDAENCTIQFCEAGYIRGATTDAGAFDIDYWQKNSTVQYCYGHDCAGYGVSVFGADPAFPTENSEVRYNIFSNNGRDTSLAFQGDFFIFTWNGGLLNGVKIHHNLSLWKPVKSAPSLKHDASYTGSNPNTFTNNIIYSDTPWIVFSRSDTLKSDSNNYWVKGGNPVWSDTKNKYYSLTDWQKASGQDMHSTYVNYTEIIPSWYKYEKPSTEFRKKKTGQIIQPGLKAPGFATNTVNGQKVNIADYKGNPVLISFICISNSSQTIHVQSMQSQLAFIKSMQRQYEEKGLKIILVDDSYRINAAGATKEILLNFTNDLELKNIALIQDNQKTGIAEKYGVVAAPATFLISRDGIILNKWENLALPAQLAFAIEDRLKK